MTVLPTSTALALPRRRAAGARPATVERVAALDLDLAHRRHAGELLGFALNAVGDRGAAEECVQDTFTRAWQARGRYDDARGSVRTWLFAIARNVVVDHLRARARLPRSVPVEEVGERGDVGLGPTSTAADQVDDRLTLLWALAQLAPAHREVVVAVRVQGLTYAELGARLDVPVGTLRRRMYHALREMRDLLAEADRLEAARRGTTTREGDER